MANKDFSKRPDEEEYDRADRSDHPAERQNEFNWKTSLRYMYRRATVWRIRHSSLSLPNPFLPNVSRRFWPGAVRNTWVLVLFIVRATRSRGWTARSKRYVTPQSFDRWARHALTAAPHRATETLHRRRRRNLSLQTTGCNFPIFLFAGLHWY